MLSHLPAEMAGPEMSGNLMREVPDDLGCEKFTQEFCTGYSYRLSVGKYSRELNYHF